MRSSRYGYPANYGSRIAVHKADVRPEKGPHMTLTRRRRIVISVVAVVLAVIFAAPFVALHIFAPKIHAILRERTEKVLRAHFQSEVEFSDFSVSLRPGVHITITGLVLRHKGRTDIPPLIQVSKVSMYASLRNLMKPKPEISYVKLDGLEIHTPPREHGGPPLIHALDGGLATKYPVEVDKGDAG